METKTVTGKISMEDQTEAQLFHSYLTNGATWVVLLKLALIEAGAAYRDIKDLKKPDLIDLVKATYADKDAILAALAHHDITTADTAKTSLTDLVERQLQVAAPVVAQAPLPQAL
jgi:hypothetical protein